MSFKHNLILASKSPRRQQILRDAGFTFEVRTKSVEEDYPDDLDPYEVAKYIALKKVSAFESGELNENELILTADTVVKSDNQILGKPRDFKQAVSMLKSLSDRSHEVITGVCLRTRDKLVSFDVTTVVHFGKLTDKDITNYIEICLPYDKAGAYGIQECLESDINFCSDEENAFIKNVTGPQLLESTKTIDNIHTGMLNITSIEGSYFNVVGLPIVEVYNHLMKF